MAKKKKKERIPVPELPDRKDGACVILGIDASLNNTALSLGVVSGDGMKFDTKVFKMKGKLSQVERIYKIQKKFRKLLKNLEKSDGLPQLAVIEGFSYGSNMHREVLGAVSFTLMVLLWRFRIHTLIISPHTLKRFLKSGNMQKSHILKEVYKEYDVDFNTDDEADAFVCMQVGISVMAVQKLGVMVDKTFRIKCAEDIANGKVGDIVLPR